MIRFFQKLRGRLLWENRFKRYIVYAVGEILLVMIGILLAVQVNNWNEARKQRVKEIHFLKSFRKNLNDNKVELNRIIDKTERTFKSADSILLYHNGTIDSLSMESFVRCMMRATGYTIYKAQDGSIQDIMGSGNLDVIKNDDLRMAIGSWEGNLKHVVEWQEIDRENNSEYLKYLHHHINFYKFNENANPINDSIKRSLVNSRIFLNHISGRANFPYILHDLYKLEIVKLDTLLEEIEIELNK